MMGFFSVFTTSLKELKHIRCLTITGIFIAISMVLEMYSINLQFFKINFAFLAIAVIGMLFGPSVGVLAGMMCDIAGYIANPSGGFYPVYVLVGGLQGLIYGICLYKNMDRYSILLQNNLRKKTTDITLYLRAIVARLLDVFLINLLIQTHLNMHYGFIPEEAYSAAISARMAKNVFELFADIPLLFVILPVALLAYKRLGASRTVSH